MQEAHVIDGLEQKFNSLVGDLDERGRRRWAATEAMALGYGGIAAVSLATGLSDGRIRDLLGIDIPTTLRLAEH